MNGHCFYHIGFGGWTPYDISIWVSSNYKHSLIPVRASQFIRTLPRLGDFHLPSSQLVCSAVFCAGSYRSSFITTLITIMTALGWGIFHSKAGRHLVFQICQHISIHVGHLLFVAPGSLSLPPCHCSINWSVEASICSPSMPNYIARVHPQPNVICSLVSSSPHIG